MGVTRDVLGVVRTCEETQSCFDSQMFTEHSKNLIRPSAAHPALQYSCLYLASFSFYLTAEITALEIYK